MPRVHGFAILILLLLTPLVASPACAIDVPLDAALADAGVRVSLSATASAAGEAADDGDAHATSVGLFIGINRYPLMEGWDLAGCVADAISLRSIFMERFGVSRAALLTNAQATRRAIVDELAALVSHVEALRRAGIDEPVTVVIAFAGHGRRVIDDSGDEDDGLDETWVAADSDFDATNDIRDDELHLVYRRLAELGAQTILISDSCHSGSMHRQSVRLRAIHHDTPPRGPSDDLFARFGSRATRSAPVRDQPLPGMVFYAACHHAQKASEHVDDLGAPCGRFTLALRGALARIGTETTYRELFDHVQREFDRLWPADRSQTPQFHADPLKAGERFLVGGPAVRHATIAPRSLVETPHGAVMRLSMGSLDGVVAGAEFRLFKTLDELADGSSPLAVVQVTEVAPLTSLAEWHGDWTTCPITIHDKALLDAVRWRDFSVALGPDLPAAVEEHFRALDAAGQIALAEAGSSAVDAAVHRVPGTTAVGLYRPGREPGPGDATDDSPAPLIAIESEGDDEAVARTLAEHALHLARMHRLMSLQTLGARSVEPQVRPQQRGDDGTLVDIDREIVDGVLRLRDGDLFTMRVRNPLETTMHVTVLHLDASANLHVLYPLEESDVATARRGRTLEIAATNPFVAGRTDGADSAAELARIKVIVSSSPLDLSALTFRPASERLGARQRRSDGSAAPTLYNLLGDLAFGGPTTRSGGTVEVEEPWAVGTVVLSIEG